MAGPPNAQLTTTRLHLRPIGPGDVDAVYTACQDPQIQRWTTVPSPYLREHAEQFACDYAPKAWAAGDAAVFGVTDRATGELLASVGLHFDRGRDAGIAEIGYWTAVAARGHGVTTEAVAAAWGWGFALCVGLRGVRRAAARVVRRGGKCGVAAGRGEGRFLDRGHAADLPATPRRR